MKVRLITNLNAVGLTCLLESVVLSPENVKNEILSTVKVCREHFGWQECNIDIPDASVKLDEILGIFFRRIEILANKTEDQVTLFSLLQRG